jgi:hypothetical protein
MTDGQPTVSHLPAIFRAMKEEGAFFFDAARLDGSLDSDPPRDLLTQCGVAMLAGAAATAKRLLREHGAGCETLRSYASVADFMERKIPAELHTMWRLHFINGHALCEYAAGTGRDIIVACADYRRLVCALLSEHGQAAERLTMGQGRLHAGTVPHPDHH